MGASTSISIPSHRRRVPLGFINSTFFRVASQLNERYPDLLETDEESRCLQNSTEQHRHIFGKPIEYRKNALAFNRAFFLRNLYKDLVAVSWYRSNHAPPTAQIEDIGSGAGTFAIAWKTMEPSTKQLIVLIDKSPEQLAIARRCFQSLGLGRATFRTIRYPYSDRPPEALGLFSYLFCESSRSKSSNQEFVYALHNRHSLIVDYPEILNRLSASFNSNARPERLDINIQIPRAVQSWIGQGALNVSALYFDDRPIYLKTLAHYFDAWLTHDTLAISKLFESEASYKILSRNRTLRGINMICDYWRRNSQRQRGLRIEWKIIRQQNELASVTFCARFFDREEHEHQAISGLIDFWISSTGLISRLSEIYQKTVGQV